MDPEGKITDGGSPKPPALSELTHTPQASPAASPPLTATVPARRRRRWLPRLLFAIVVLLIVLIVVIQVVLSSDIPRSIAVAEVQRALGLKMSAKTLRSGWFGQTTLTDVTLSLPLSDGPFVTLPEMRVDHTSLVGIALTQNVKLKSIEMRKPLIRVMQDDAGRWNLQEVVDLLNRAGGESDTTATAPRSPASITLPRVRVEGAQVDITDSQGRHVVIAPIDISGDMQDALTWNFQLSAPADDAVPRVKLAGVIVPGGTWKHQVKFDARNLGEWAKPWTADWPDPATISGDWNGQAVDGGVSGRLQLAGVDVGDIHVRAGSTLLVEAGAGAVSVTPESLVIHVDNDAVPDVQVIGGQMRSEAGALTIAGLRVSVSGGSARMDGAWRLSERAGHLEVAWDQVEYPANTGIRHVGDVRVDLADRFPSAPEIGVKLNTHGDTGSGSWDAQLHVGGRGESWQTMDVTVSVPAARWNAKKVREVRDITALLNVRWPTITLASVVHADSDRLGISGAYTFATDMQCSVDATSQPATDALRETLQAAGEIENLPTTGSADSLRARDKWWLWIDGRDWPVPKFPDKPLQFSFSGWGSGVTYIVDDLYAAIGDTWLSLKGVYDIRRPAPVEANLYVASAPELGINDDDELPLRGHLNGDARLTGTLFPMAIAFEGNLHGNELLINDRPLENPHLQIVGAFFDDRAEAHTRELRIFDSVGQLDLQYPYGGESVGVKLGIDDLSLAKLAAFAKVPALSGTADGKWEVTFPTNLKKSRVRLTGQVQATDVRLNALAIDTLSATTTLRDGELTVWPIRVARQSGETSGTGEARVSLNIRRPDFVDASLKLEDWPVEMNEGRIVATGSVMPVRITPGKMEQPLKIDGKIAMKAALTFRDQALGEAEIEATLKGREIILDRFDGDMAGGHVTGELRLDVDNPRGGVAQFAWAGVRPELFAPFVPQLAELQGEFDGSINLRPAEDARALEPVEIDLKLDPRGGRFRTIDLGLARIKGFARFPSNDASDQRFRFVLGDPSSARSPAQIQSATTQPTTHADDESGNVIHLAGGVVRPWARFTRLAGEKFSSQLTLELEHLDLNQLMQAAKPDFGATPGEINGRINVLGNPRELDRLTGDASIDITKSDLVNFPPFAVLYSILSVQLGPPEPRGAGTLRARLEQSTLTLTDLEYFNKGIYARGYGTVEKIFDSPNSPINAYLVGTSQPLRDLKVPFASDVNKIFSAIQETSSTVRVTGTVDKMKIEQAALAEIGGELQRLLIGETKK